MERQCRYVPLGKQPLVLVLAQVRFSRVRQMASFVPSIQEGFRRNGFPVERSGEIQQVAFRPGGQPEITTQQRWEFRTKDETWSVLLFEDGLVLQTTAYERFEKFAGQLEQALDRVFRATDHDRLGVVHRLGLRYVDVVQPGEGEDYRAYLRPGLHAVADEVFLPGSHRLHVESIGRTRVGDVDGTMIVRVIQNDQGYLLPPDLLASAPKLAPRADPGELLTLVDMDHYLEGTFDADPGWVVARAYEMHDHLIETFHDHVVSEHAIEVWR